MQLLRYVTMMLAGCSLCSAVTAAEPENTKPQDVFDGMRESFRADRAEHVNLRYQFELSGPDGGDWFIEVHDGKCTVDKGKIDNPDVTIIASAQDWVALSNGTLPGFWAHLTGRLKIHGDRSLARKLDDMFP
jgi:putative sterol carrier protein